MRILTTIQLTLLRVAMVLSLPLLSGTSFFATSVINLSSTLLTIPRQKPWLVPIPKQTWKSHTHGVCSQRLMARPTTTRLASLLSKRIKSAAPRPSTLWTLLFLLPKVLAARSMAISRYMLSTPSWWLSQKWTSLFTTALSTHKKTNGAFLVKIAKSKWT